MVATVSLNAFLRKLPELVVDNLTFHRKVRRSLYFIGDGVWKLRKVGYNKYVLQRFVLGDFVPYRGEWHSDPGTGDIQIVNINVSIRGVNVFLGEDVPSNGDD